MPDPLEIFRRLGVMHPGAKAELNYTTPYELLIATVLSAQCTDVRVNLITEELFRRVRTPEDMLALSRSELEEIIRTCGMYKQKARALQEAAQELVDRFDSEVPSDRAALESLRGVGRKTASVVLSNAFGIPAIAVDTHVGRVARRLGLTELKDPDKVAGVLEELFPPDCWTELHHRLIFHGRYLCKARNPDCERCLLEDICPKIGVRK
ncbi:MAG TPA: endonuclease III [Tissierellia bacterium]|nr:endonuclease III [Tissierellia bacterium]